MCRTAISEFHPVRKGADVLVAFEKELRLCGRLAFQADELTVRCEEQEILQRTLEGEVSSILEANRKRRVELKELELDYTESLKTLASLTGRAHELEILVLLSALSCQP